MRRSILSFLLASGLACTTFAAPPRYQLQVVDGSPNSTSRLLGIAADGRVIGLTTSDEGVEVLWTATAGGQRAILAQGHGFSARLAGTRAVINHEDDSNSKRMAWIDFPSGISTSVRTGPTANELVTQLTCVAPGGSMGLATFSGSLTGWEFNSYVGTPARWVKCSHLPTPAGAVRSRNVLVNDLNASGIATGIAAYQMNDGAAASRAATWRDGRITVLPLTANANASTASAINDSETVAGLSAKPDVRGRDGVQNWVTLWRRGTATEVAGIRWQVGPEYHEVPEPTVNDLNSTELAVGTMLYTRRDAGPSSMMHGFLVESDTMRDLNDLIDRGPASWTIVEAAAINDSGVIAATATRSDADGLYAVKLTPMGSTGGGGGTAPTTPAAPMLADSSDTGFSSSDGVTAARILVFSVEAPANSLIRMYVDGAPMTQTWTAAQAGPTQVTITTPPAGRHTYAVSVTSNGRESPRSAETVVTRDPSKPATLPRPAMLGTTSTSSEVTTTNQRPTITGRATPSHRVNIYLNGRMVKTITPDRNGEWRYRPTEPLSRGRTASFAVEQVSPSGLVSARSKSLKIKIPR